MGIWQLDMPFIDFHRSSWNWNTVMKFHTLCHKQVSDRWKFLHRFSQSRPVGKQSCIKFIVGYLRLSSYNAICLWTELELLVYIFPFTNWTPFKILAKQFETNTYFKFTREHFCVKPIVSSHYIKFLVSLPFVWHQQIFPRVCSSYHFTPQ